MDEDEALARALQLQESQSAGYGYGYYGYDDMMDVDDGAGGGDDDDDWEMGGGDDDDDWGGKAKAKKGGKKKAGGKAGAAAGKKAARTPKSASKSIYQGTPPSQNGEEDADGLNTEDGAASIKKQKEAKTPKERITTQSGMGSWTDEEETKFLEGLEIHGRNWKGISVYMGTRDPQNVSSHAQMHFIKLCVQGKELPDKVKESGLGYTLGGRNSHIHPRVGAATRHFKDVPKHLYSEATKREIERFVVALWKERCEKGNCGGVGKVKEKGRGRKREVGDRGDGGDSVEGEGAAGKSKKAKSSPPSPPATSQSQPSNLTENTPENSVELPTPQSDPTPTPTPPTPPRTAYALARPKRAVTTKRVYAEDPLDLHIPIPFRSAPGNPPEEDPQPFRCHVSRSAVCVMDLHAHVVKCEVIGYLAGRFERGDAQTPPTLHIHRALPMTSPLSHSSHVSVDADPESQAKAMQEAEREGLRVVGWYHSHPCFRTCPSGVDVLTQGENQRAWGWSGGVAGGEEGGEDECPFVGAIVGPYDPEHKTSSSSLTFFMVQGGGGGSPSSSAASSKLKPRLLGVEMEAVDGVRRRGVERGVVDVMMDLIKSTPTTTCAEDRIDFSTRWKSGRSETRRKKLGRSLRGWLCGGVVDDDEGGDDGEEKGVEEGWVGVEECLRVVMGEVGRVGVGEGESVGEGIKEVGGLVG
ncbi:hypothetical protein HDV00_005017 [Rhizophlyctis rosea]|nr:hypothetical protein HDV00_005017 [Rhizophlyctis rosea]